MLDTEFPIIMVFVCLYPAYSCEITGIYFVGADFRWVMKYCSLVGT